MAAPAAASAKPVGRSSSSTASPVSTVSSGSSHAIASVELLVAMRSFKQMDLDAFTAARREDWMRLARLSHNWRFTGREADELINRYQAGASDLSTIRTNIGQSSQGGELSLSLGRARRKFTGTSTN